MKSCQQFAQLSQRRPEMAEITCTCCGLTFESDQKRLKQSGPVCRPCVREKERAYRSNRKAAGNPVVSTKMPPAYHQEYQKAYSQDPVVRARRASAEAERRRDDRHKPKILARLAVRNALRRGALIKGDCEVCGSDKTEGHHDDYDRPLDVRWLCRNHHREHHIKATGAA